MRCLPSDLYDTVFCWGTVASSFAWPHPLQFPCGHCNLAAKKIPLVLTARVRAPKGSSRNVHVCVYRVTYIILSDGNTGPSEYITVSGNVDVVRKTCTKHVVLILCVLLLVLSCLVRNCCWFGRVHCCGYLMCIVASLKLSCA
jgi:hypothetical protein